VILALPLVRVSWPTASNQDASRDALERIGKSHESSRGTVALVGRDSAYLRGLVGYLTIMKRVSWDLEQASLQVWAAKKRRCMAEVVTLLSRDMSGMS